MGCYESRNGTGSKCASKVRAGLARLARELVYCHGTWHVTDTGGEYFPGLLLELFSSEHRLYYVLRPPKENCYGVRTAKRYSVPTCRTQRTQRTLLIYGLSNWQFNKPCPVITTRVPHCTKLPPSDRHHHSRGDNGLLNWDAAARSSMLLIPEIHNNKFEIFVLCIYKGQQWLSCLFRRGSSDELRDFSRLFLYFEWTSKVRPLLY